jgi:hypothetical protein
MDGTVRTFPDRRGEPDTTYAVSLAGGRQVAITTDGRGRVTPASADEAAVADHHGLAPDAPAKRAAKATTIDTGPAAPAEEA